jgi:hypothetical protein
MERFTTKPQYSTWSPLVYPERGIFGSSKTNLQKFKFFVSKVKMLPTIAAVAAAVGFGYLLGPVGTMAVGIGLSYLAVPLAILASSL